MGTLHGVHMGTIHGVHMGTLHGVHMGTLHGNMGSIQYNRSLALRGHVI